MPTPWIGGRVAPDVVAPGPILSHRSHSCPWLTALHQVDSNSAADIEEAAAFYTSRPLSSIPPTTYPPQPLGRLPDGLHPLLPPRLHTLVPPSSPVDINLRVDTGIPEESMEEQERWTVEAEPLGGSSTAGITLTNSFSQPACPVATMGGVSNFLPGAADMDDLLGRMLEETYKAKLQEKGAYPPGGFILPESTPACAARRDQADCHQWTAIGGTGQQQRPGQHGMLKGDLQQQLAWTGVPMQPRPEDDAWGPADQCRRGGGGRGHSRPPQRSRGEQEGQGEQEGGQQGASGDTSSPTKGRIRQYQLAETATAGNAPREHTWEQPQATLPPRCLVSCPHPRQRPPNSGGGGPTCMHPLAAEAPVGKRPCCPKSSSGGAPSGMPGVPLAGYASSSRSLCQYVRDLGELATDPALSAQERVQRIGQYSSSMPWSTTVK